MKRRGPKEDGQERDLILSLATSDLNLAQVFAAGARSAYHSGRMEDGEFARLKTVKFYCEALRSVLQMSGRDRESFSDQLQNLRSQIEWLSMQTAASFRSSVKPQEDVSMEKLCKLLEEKG